MKTIIDEFKELQESTKKLKETIEKDPMEYLGIKPDIKPTKPEKPEDDRDEDILPTENDADEDNNEISRTKEYDNENYDKLEYHE